MSTEAFKYDGDEVKVVNSAAQALYDFQTAMTGEAEKAGLQSIDDVVAMLKESRE